jgi:hypothetical protein
MKLLPPIFRVGAAVVSEKIDRLAREIASIINGGLDAQNLANGLLLDITAFTETYSVFAMRAVVHPAYVAATFGVVRFPSQIIGWGMKGNSTLTILSNGVPILTITPRPLPATKLDPSSPQPQGTSTPTALTDAPLARDANLYTSGNCGPIAVPLGALLTCQASGGCHVTLTLKTVHQG